MQYIGLLCLTEDLEPFYIQQHGVECIFQSLKLKKIIGVLFFYVLLSSEGDDLFFCCLYCSTLLLSCSFFSMEGSIKKLPCSKRFCPINILSGIFLLSFMLKDIPSK